MKRLLMGLALASVLSVASAQGRLFGEVLSGGVGLVPNFGLSLALRAGAEGLLGPLDVRGGLATDADSEEFDIMAYADLLYPVQVSDLKVNLGGGVGLTMSRGSGASSTLFGLRGIGGLEFPLQRYFSLLAELRFSVTFPSSRDPQMGLRIFLGPRVYF